MLTSSWANRLITDSTQLEQIVTAIQYRLSSWCLSLQAALTILTVHGKHIIHGNLTAVNFCAIYRLCEPVSDRLRWLQHNVLIDSRGNAYVTDFGLSAILAECDNSPFDAHHPGSVRWAAPELLNLLTDEEAGKPTTCSDVYSFGSVAVEVCQCLLYPALATFWVMV
jgi:serine/threonine protein kinase